MLEKTRNMLNRLNLSQQFMLASMVVIILGMIGIGLWVGQQITNGIVNHAGATTALYLDSFVAPLLQDLAYQDLLSEDDIDQLSMLIEETPLGQRVVTYKIWDPSGRLIYSTNMDMIGKMYPLTEGLVDASNGMISSEISELTDEENADLREPYGSLLETYSPIRLKGTNQVIAVAEFYETLDTLQTEITIAQQRSWLVVGLSMLLIYLFLSLFVRRANDTIDRQQNELSIQVDQLTTVLNQNNALHERIRRAAASVTTLNEHFLRRIGSELHDGPAQDLGLALLKLDTVVATCEDDKATNQNDLHQKFDDIQSSLQNALKEIRSISTGLSLPYLNKLTLAEVIQRAIRTHMRRTGSDVDLTIGEIPDEASMPVKITVYRLLQEALNNAYLHAGGKDQAVSVMKQGKDVLILISDQGPGFDPKHKFEQNGHLGLVGMRERVESLGGVFELDSSDGDGTQITARIPVQAEWS